MKQNLEEWKLTYNEKAKAGIGVDWDGGHAYHLSPWCPDECEDADAASDYDSEYLSDNGPELFCVPELINQLTKEFSVCACDCGSHEDGKENGQEIEYINGFMQLAIKAGSAEWYHTDKLKVWIENAKLIEFTQKLIDS